MTNELRGSILGQVALAFSAGGKSEADEVQTKLLNERSAELAEWMNGWALIDKPYLAFVLTVAAEGLNANLTSYEKSLLAQMQKCMGASMILSPVAPGEEDPDHG